MAAVVEDLERFARSSGEADGELRRAASRLCAVGVTEASSLGAELAAHAASWSAVDRWVGDVAAAFRRADGGSLSVAVESVPLGPVGLPAPRPLVVLLALLGLPAPDEGRAWVAETFGAIVGRATVGDVARLLVTLDDDDVWDLARQLAALLTAVGVGSLAADDRDYLRGVLWPIRARLRERWPEAMWVDPERCRTVPVAPPELDGVLDALRLVERRREANFLVGLFDGALLGDIDAEGFDNGWGEFGRIVGQFAGGLVPVVADARDAVANLARGEWLDAALAAVFAVPGFGDAARGVKDLDRGLNLLDDVRDGSRAVHAADLITGELWTTRRAFPTPALNAYDHFRRHGSDFPEANNALEYAALAHQFLHNPPGGTLIKVRDSGDVVMYHPGLEWFAIMRSDGTPRTLYVPDPSKHDFRTNLEYFIHGK